MNRGVLDEVVAGLIVAAIGAFFLYHSFSYGIGPVNRMQPGHFPMLLGAIAVALGLAIAAIGMLRGGAADGSRRRWPVRSILAVLAGIAAFALLLRPLGLVPAAAIAAAAAAAGDPTARLPAILGVGLFMGALAWAVFKLGFGLTVPSFDWRF
ncbi:MAG: tripartite tricarboxylate transporter TctB family protein [Rhodobacteraceae bacterium]|jgi:hypothetical protein|nr:tripartite tricarboxylate transporter TctB family protein [Paracoccaceae bacterium]